MNLKVNSKEMKAAMSIVAKAIASKSALPILDCVLISIGQDGRLVLTGGDQEMKLSVSCPVIEVEGFNPICVNAATLTGALSNLAPQPITFSVQGNQLTLVYASGHFNLPTFQAAEYPEVPENIEAISQFTMPCADFADMMRLCRPHVGNDTLRPVMNGVYLDMRGEHLVAAATDGHRLIRKGMPDVKRHESHAPAGAIVSAHASRLLGLLPKDGDVTIRIGRRQTAFFADGYMLVATSIEGNYPNYNAVIPKSSTYRAVVNRAEIINALRRVTVMSSNTGLVALRFNTLMGAEGRLAVEVEDRDFAQSGYEEISAEHNAPNGFSIGFKADFLSALFATHTTDTVVFQFTDPSRAGVLQDTEGGDPNLLTMLMPMMLQD